MPEYIAKYGAAVIDNDYEIVAIRPGTKRPFGDDWQDVVVAKRDLKRFSSFGVGIKARHTPGVDLDVRDEAMVAHLRQFTIDLCGETLERTGLPPKLLLVYRSEEPWRKVNSKVYLDDDGNRTKVEILGNGQQYVCFAIHPDTKKPYRWKDAKAPHNTERSDLPVITREQGLEIAAEFERLADEAGWRLAPSSKTSLATVRKGNVDLDDVFATDKQVVDITTDELTSLLHRVPGKEDYETWYHIGMALYHQFEGDEEGLTLWHQWSTDAPNYDTDALDEKWSTFDVEGKGREPITARIIIKWAKAEDKRLATEAFGDYKAKLQTATSLDDLTEICDEIKKLVFSVPLRETLASLVKSKLKDFGNASPSISLARSMVRYESKEVTVAPPWMKPFVYVSDEDRFYSTRTGSLMTAKAFDSSFDRYMLTPTERLEGMAEPAQHAASVALNRVQIPIVAHRRYMPGEDQIFKLDGQKCVNTYSDETVPEMPEKFSALEGIIAARITRHFEHLFPIERDRKLLLSWCAYIVQNLGERCNWAPLLQGVDGDGKTTIGEWLTAALGSDNGDVISGTALEEKFTGWAEGHQFIFIEEVRLHGENRYDIVNKVKTYITNLLVSIRRMREDGYSVPNMTSYMLTSNFKDALPTGANDNRYYAMFSRFQRGEDLIAFNEGNPNYYTELREVLGHPGVIRKFFMDYELHPGFHHNRRAPISAARREMQDLERDEDEDAFADLLKSGKPWCSETLLDSAVASEEMQEFAGTLPRGKALARFLSKAGFMSLGRISACGQTRRLWTRTPSIFVDEAGNPDPNLVRAIAEDEDPL